MFISRSTCATIGSRSIVQEFQAPTFRSEGQLQFELLLLAGLITSGFLLRRRLFAEALVGGVSGPRVAHQRAACSALCHRGRAADRLPRSAMVAGRSGGHEEVFGFANSLPARGGPDAGVSPDQHLASRVDSVFGRSGRAAEVAARLSERDVSDRDGPPARRPDRIGPAADSGPMGRLHHLQLLPSAEGLRRRP